MGFVKGLITAILFLAIFALLMVDYYVAAAANDIKQVSIACLSKLLTISLLATTNGYASMIYSAWCLYSHTFVIYSMSMVRSVIVSMVSVVSMYVYDG
jgi:hypothetical protein